MGMGIRLITVIYFIYLFFNVLSFLIGIHFIYLFFNHKLMPWPVYTGIRTMSSLEEVSKNKVFGGVQKVFKHQR